MFDPRTKLLAILPGLIIIFLLSSPLALTVLLILLQLLFLFSRSGRSKIGSIWKSVLPLCLFIMILWPFFEPSRQDLIFNSRFLKLGYDNLTSALRMGLRLACLVFLSYYPLITIKQSSLLLAFIRLGVPYHWAFTIVMAMESVPDLTSRWHQIRQAQQLRGLELDRGHFFDRLSSMIPLLTAVIVSALRDSEKLSYSLINRGMELEGERTWMESLSFQWYDLLLLLLLTFGAVFLIINSWPAG